MDDDVGTGGGGEFEEEVELLGRALSTVASMDLLHTLPWAKSTCPAQASPPEFSMLTICERLGELTTLRQRRRRRGGTVRVHRHVEKVVFRLKKVNRYCESSDGWDGS